MKTRAVTIGFSYSDWMNVWRENTYVHTHIINYFFPFVFDWLNTMAEMSKCKPINTRRQSNVERKSNHFRALIFNQLKTRISAEKSNKALFETLFCSTSKEHRRWLSLAIRQGKRIVTLQSALFKWAQTHQPVKMIENCLGALCNPTCPEKLMFVDTAVQWSEDLVTLLGLVSLVPTVLCVALRTTFYIQSLLVSRAQKESLRGSKSPEVIKPIIYRVESRAQIVHVKDQLHEVWHVRMLLMRIVSLDRLFFFPRFTLVVSFPALRTRSSVSHAWKNVQVTKISHPWENN